ncbi:MAG: hypothetical protein DPW12_03225 [Rhodocyclaceae bacterium]|nr:hypothetical protein [Rhodocyclaceae bacterium]
MLPAPRDGVRLAAGELDAPEQKQVERLDVVGALAVLLQAELPVPFAAGFIQGGDLLLAVEVGGQARRLAAVFRFGGGGRGGYRGGGACRSARRFFLATGGQACADRDDRRNGGKPSCPGKGGASACRRHRRSLAYSGRGCNSRR